MQLSSFPDDLRVNDVILHRPEHQEEKHDGYGLPE
jgi:hypothetical protein